LGLARKRIGWYSDQLKLIIKIQADGNTTFSNFDSEFIKQDEEACRSDDVLRRIMYDGKILIANFIILPCFRENNTL